MSVSSWIKKIFALFLSVILLSTIASVAVSAETPSQELNADIDLQIEQSQPYLEYLDKYSRVKDGEETIIIEAAQGYTAAQDVSVVDNIGGDSGKSLKTSDVGYVEWQFDVANEGLYEMWVEYYPLEGKESSIIRSIYIDGSLPFEEARNIKFDRIWEHGDKRTDRLGNEIKPEQNQVSTWITAPMCDGVGYIEENLSFYLSEGSHTLRLVSLSEPMILRKIYFKNDNNKIPSYKEVKEKYSENNYDSPDTEITYIEAENLLKKSHAVLLPANDRSSASVSPNHAVQIRLNHISSTQWKESGQWIEWSFKVKKSGLYKIVFKAKQDVVNGMNSHRKVLINGETPFKEMSVVSFPYSIRWEMTELGDDNGAFQFYFEEGKTYTINLEAVLGENGKYIKYAEDIVFELNEARRELLTLIGSTPDYNRDYQFEIVLPDTIDALKDSLPKLKKVKEEIVKEIGFEGEFIQPIKNLIDQLVLMTDKPDVIAKVFNEFTNNITALSTWITDAKSQPLCLDYIAVAPYETDVPKTTVGFLDEVMFHLRAFFATFVGDYNVTSDDNEDAVTVWIGNGDTGGRDQAQLLKLMSDNTFTPKTNIPVNLQLVAMSSLLPATLAGIGPDVALTVGSVMDYAARHAIVDLTQFEDCEEVLKRFSPSIITPLQFNGGVYALPESESFSMMYFRKDILQDLGLKVPDTWDEVLIMLPKLQKKMMNFGFPGGTSSGLYSMLLLQYGGDWYSEDLKESLIDSQESIDALHMYSRVFSDYGSPVTYDFLNQFRAGTIPIGIAGYTLYNQLSVFAPELDGLWGYAPIPGTIKEDGTIDRTTSSSGAACIILQTSKKKKEAWEYIKWWTSADVQAEFGIEMENILGPTARYETANLEAFDRIPWDTEAAKQIKKQWTHIEGVPAVPGSYYTGRYLGFVILEVVNNSKDPGEFVFEYKKIIDDEIADKRKEFGLDN